VLYVSTVRGVAKICIPFDTYHKVFFQVFYYGLSDRGSCEKAIGLGTSFSKVRSGVRFLLKGPDIPFFLGSGSGLT